MAPYGRNIAHPQSPYAEVFLTDDAVLKNSLKRKRGYDEDPSSRQEKLRKLEPNPTRLYSGGLLPPEIGERIPANLNTDDLPASIDDNENFVLANKFFRNIVAGKPVTKKADDSIKIKTDGGSPALKRFDGLVKRLRSLAVKTFRDIVPKDGLPDQPSFGVPRDQRRYWPVAAHDVTDTVGPILRHQPRVGKKKLTGSIVDLESERVASETINSLARFSRDLDEEQRLGLAHDSVVLFWTDGALLNDDRVKAAEALARFEMYGHLTLEQRRVINEAATSSLGLGSLLEDTRRELRTERSATLPAASNAPNDRAEMPIDYLKEQYLKASTPLVYTDHGRLDVLQPIVREIPELYNHVRAELVSSLRNDRVR
jgi:hypothetical protein